MQRGHISVHCFVRPLGTVLGLTMPERALAGALPPSQGLRQPASPFRSSSLAEGSPCTSISSSNRQLVTLSLFASHLSPLLASLSLSLSSVSLLLRSSRAHWAACHTFLQESEVGGWRRSGRGFGFHYRLRLLQLRKKVCPLGFWAVSSLFLLGFCSHAVSQGNSFIHS